MKKKTMLLITVATVSGSALVQAALPERFARMDTDADGKLNKTEYVEGRLKREKPIIMKDKNLTEAQYQAKVEGFQGNYKQDFAKKDGNKDGFLTGAELAPGAAVKPLPERFAKMDTNKDGKLTKAEYVEGRLKREKPILMKQKNLTEEQYQAKVKDLRGNYNQDFKTKDKNMDGFLTSAELSK